MHCLPADIGAEVSAGVMERFRVDVAREANKKVYVIMALLAAAKRPGCARSCSADSIGTINYCHPERQRGPGRG